MVWGMSLPSSFGEYWPEGSFESDPQQPLSAGWSDRLREFYFAQPPEKQQELFDYRGDHDLAAHSYAGFVSSKFIMEQGVSRDVETPPVNAIKPHEPPKFFQTEKNQKRLASLIKLNNRIIAVDEALKSIIERLEPRVHQFFPIEIKMRRDQVYPTQFYTLVIGQYLNSFSPEDSNPDAVKQWKGYDLYTHDETKKGVSGLAFKKSIFGEWHAWREKRFTSLLTCFSDELISEINKAELRIPKHYRMKEV